MDTETQKEIARNEPCPCGSGKKYKRCHGVSAAPKLFAPKAPEPGATPAMPGLPGGLDASQLDPEMLKQMNQMLSRLPRAQLMKLQALMQRAMKGEDISRESAELERLLPPEFQAMSRAWAMQSLMSQAGASQDTLANMTPEEAKKIIEAAQKEGKISSEQASELLSVEVQGSQEKPGLLKRFFGKK
jgi:hypothetical protein